AGMDAARRADERGIATAVRRLDRQVAFDDGQRRRGRRRGRDQAAADREGDESAPGKIVVGRLAPRSFESLVAHGRGLRVVGKSADDATTSRARAVPLATTRGK